MWDVLFLKLSLGLSSVLNKVIASMPGPAMQKPASGKTTSPEQDFPSTFYLSPIKVQSQMTLIDLHNGHVPGHRLK